VRVERLRGGVSCSVQAVRLESRDGPRSDIVVRRYTSEYHTDKGVAAREFRVLQVLTSLAYPCPRPLLLEEDEAVFGAPTIIMTRLPGRGTLAPPDLNSYLDQLAHSLVQLHRLPTRKFDFLPREREFVQRTVDRGPQTADPLEQEIWTALREHYPAVARADRQVVLHGDFWPGNTVWHRDQLSGVVDWEGVRLGDPGKDVAICRLDVANIFGAEAARVFTELYERERGEAVAGLAFWDLRQASSAMRYMSHWAAGYQDLGRPELTTEETTRKTAQFARAALDQLRA
jgi:aminoglycoside phosphotransferase (APT) family kinase protein